MKSLNTVLGSRADLRGWQTQSLGKNSIEVYAVLDEIETARCNHTNSYTLRVQTPIDAAFMGESSARFQGKSESLAALVDAAARRARLVKNPVYNFPEQQSFREDVVDMIDCQIAEATLNDVVEYAKGIQEYRKRRLPAYPLNSLEVYFEKYDLSLANHRFCQAEAQTTRVLCDYVLTSPDNKHEIMGLKKRRFLRDLDIESQLEEDAAVLADLESAVLPPTGELSVILAGDALDSLFDFFIAQLEGHALFNRYSVFQKGDWAVRDAKEGLNIDSYAQLAGGMYSYRFDDLGFKTADVELVRDSQVKNFLIDGRYADLLHLPQTSALTNIRVGCGTTNYADFISDGVLELSKFSTFQPNTVSGAFSGEIRLGYLHKNGKKIPVKGGSVSGSTQTAFAAAYKSKEEVRRAAYLGPKGVFFERLTVAGD